MKVWYFEFRFIGYGTVYCDSISADNMGDALTSIGERFAVAPNGIELIELRGK